MAQLRGSTIQVNASTDGAVWHPVGEMNSAEMALSGASLDVTEFGDEEIARIIGLIDCQWSLSGFYDPTDTQGQVVCRNALTAKTALYIQMLFDPTGAAGSQGFSQMVVPTKFDVKGTPADVQTVDLSLDGSGPITAV